MGKREPLYGLIILMGVLLTFLPLQQLFAATPIELSESEQAWIKKHPVVKIGVDGNWPPIDFKNSKGIHQGITADYLHQIEKQTGIRIQIESESTWNKMMKRARRGELDGVATIAKTAEREKLWSFSNSYMSSSYVIVTRRGARNISKFSDLKGMTVAVEEGYNLHELLSRDFKGIRLHVVDDSLQALKAVSREQADAYIGVQHVALWLIEKHGLHNIKATADFNLDAPELHVAVRPDWPEFISIINKVIAGISYAERRKILKRWLAESDKVRGESFQLTPQERRWLNRHPKLQIAINSSWAPMDFVDSAGEPKGIGVDYLQLLNKRLGVKIEIVPGGWSDIYEQVKEGKIDALMDITPKKEREEYFNFTRPYAIIPHVIIANSKGPYYRGLDDLAGKTMAIEKGFFIVKYLQDNYSDITIKEYSSTTDAIEAVAKGEADAYVGNRAVAIHIIETGLLKSLQIQGKIDATSSINSIGVRKDRPELAAILDRALADISRDEKRLILQEWGGEEKERVALTPTEKAWLKEHPRLRLGVDVAWPPIEYIDKNDQYSGLASDYMKIVAKQLNIELIPLRDLSWDEVMEKVQQGEVDVISAITPTSERKKFLNFTGNYLKFSLVLFTQVDMEYISGLESLSGKRVLVEEGYVTQEYLLRNHPEIRTVAVATTAQALEMLSNGKADAYFGNLISSGHVIAEHGLTNIKVAAQTPYFSNLAIGVRKDWPELVPMLQKALDSIDDNVKSAIRNRWVSIRLEKQIDYTLLWQVITGALLAIMLILVWLNQTKRQNRALNEGRQKLKLTLNSANLGAWDMYVDSTSSTAICSDFFAIHHGASPEKKQFTAVEYLKSIAPEHTKQVEGAFADYISGRNEEFSEEYLTRAGRWVHIEGKVFERDDDGKITRLIGISQDVTARKEAEEELAVAKQKAEEATKAKGNFLANMSHEIRTPMNAIIGLGHLAMMTELTPKQHDYLTKINSSSNALLGIINDILDFSKIEAGKLDMESVQFDLNEVLENLTNMVALKASEKGLEFLISIPPNLPANLVGDPLRLGQVLINLVNNAVKFTDEGEITVSISVLKANRRRAVLRFEVHDTGMGMTRKQQKRLFKAFSQADSSTTRKYGGTGLGLTISKRLTEMMGGEIGVDSVAGEGSTFYFTAEFERVESDMKNRHLLPRDLLGLRVLIVDDNATSREILSTFMESFGFEISEAASGAEAIEEVEREGDERPYNLVLLDWKMPGMNGIETGKRIKHLKHLKVMPAVIMISAYGREELMRDSQQAGLDGYLVKPVTQSALFDNILMAFGKRIEKNILVSDATLTVAEHVRGAHLLLVEDNAINQQVAKELLEKAGLMVTIVSNGKQCIQALEAEQFDGVLMDLQMPVMGGIEATQKIRKDEHFRNLPIIAMTANAMAGDRERCIEAGMNDHISKPINLNELCERLNQWITASKPIDPVASDAESQQGIAEQIEIPKIAGVDVEDGIRRVSGNRALYRDLLIQFCNGSGEHMSELKVALKHGHVEVAKRIAHTLKGVAGNISAIDLQNSALALESSLKSGEMSEAKPLLKALEKQFMQLRHELSFLDCDREHSKQKVKEAHGKMDTEAIYSQLIRLKGFLLDNDSEASVILDELETELRGSAVQAEFRQLSTCIDHFDYDKALQILDELIPHFNVNVDDSGGDK